MWQWLPISEMLSWAIESDWKGEDELFNKGNFELAEHSWRAELTRYVGWVFQHTLMFLKHAEVPPIELVAIDVGALEGLAEQIAWALKKQGKRESFVHSFDHLSKTVPLPGLKERMIYLECLWLLHHLDDEKQAEQIMAAWSSYDEIHDVKLLQIFLEMRAASLSVVKQMEIAKEIVKRTDSSVEKLHYSTVNTMRTLLVGDLDEAKKMHTEALNAYLPAATIVANDGDYYPSQICAFALEMQGVLYGDQIAFDRALGYLQKIDRSELIDTAAGEILYEMGRQNWLRGDYKKGIECFSDSYKKSPGPLSLIYRLDAYVRLNELDKAKQDYACLRRDGVPEDYRLEFLRSAAGLAVKSGNAEEARRLIEELKRLELKILEFRRQRDNLCVALLEFINEELTKKTSASRRQSFFDRIRKASAFFELKPNFFGFGLNLNKLFESEEKDK